MSFPRRRSARSATLDECAAGPFIVGLARRGAPETRCLPAGLALGRRVSPEPATRQDLCQCLGRSSWCVAVTLMGVLMPFSWLLSPRSESRLMAKPHGPWIPIGTDEGWLAGIESPGALALPDDWRTPAPHPGSIFERAFWAAQKGHAPCSSPALRITADGV